MYGKKILAREMFLKGSGLYSASWSCNENSSHQFPVTHTSANLLRGSAVQLCPCGTSGLLTCPGDGHTCGHGTLAQRITEDLLN